MERGKGGGGYAAWRSARIGIQLLFLAGALALLYLGQSRFLVGLSPLLGLLQALAAGFGLVLVSGAVVLAVTLVAGRWFCGWVCPVGTLQQCFGWLGERVASRGERAREISKRLGWKYLVLAGTLVPVVFGVSWAGWLDPLAVLTRGVEALDGLLGIDRREDWVPSGMLVADGLLLLLLVAASARWTRLWCRHICPLGAGLGAAALASRVRILRDPDSCTRCNECLRVCQHGCIDGKQWFSAECNYCLNCLVACPTRALTLATGAHGGALVDRLPMRSRRSFLASALAGGALGAAMVRRTVEVRGFPPDLIRPPGAVPEEHFLRRCHRCGACMRECPFDVIRPVLAEGGLAATFTPKLDFSVSYCRLNCDRCGQACPSGAIQPFSLDVRKPDTKAPLRVGLAYIDVSRCLPWAYDKGCVTCNEFCPTSPKAVKLVPVPGSDLNGPRVDPVQCIGCGACEFVCPLPLPAIIVTSANESRHPDNHVTLRGSEGGVYGP